MTPSPTSAPLIQIERVSKVYKTGGLDVRALDDVSLTIERGEFVAIIGQSGSGKSTLMNLLGCLDTPSEGQYRVAGVEVGTLSSDELAGLRCDVFGFVFQRYNLLATMTAIENVELPAIYAGVERPQRIARAKQLIAQLGLESRGEHRPGELSGGQQQRVSIARALMNGAEVILADEPTGALDTQSGSDMLSLLKDLHARGHTIILITHDAEVAAIAERTITISDGKIINDTGTTSTFKQTHSVPIVRSRGSSLSADVSEAIKMAVRSLRSNIFRTALTLLGVVIGVAAVVVMLAIGNGSKENIMTSIESMGTNLLMVRPGAPGIRGSRDTATLVEGDAIALVNLPHVAALAPERSSSITMRYGNADFTSQIIGTWPSYANVKEWQTTSGGWFTDADVKGYAPVVVLGQTVVDALFPNGEDPIGRYVLMTNIPFEVVGVLATKGATPFGSDQDSVAIVPLSTGFMRIFGQQYLSTISVKIDEADNVDPTQTTMTRILLDRHRTEDFQIRNTSSMMEMASTASNTMTILLGSVAAISLLVGGIGVMNIMLVSVTERTREIGIRMATGARESNILLQFNIEAMVVCGVGGLIGVLAGIGFAVAAGAFGLNVAITAAPSLIAFLCAFATGMVFGYLPARKAAQLDPVIALSSE